LRLFRCQNPSFLPIAFSYSSGNIVPCAYVRVSLTCSLFRYNAFFFLRSVPISLSHHLCQPFSPSPPSARLPLRALFRTLLRFTCSRPLAPLSLSLSDSFSGSTFGTVAATSSVILSMKNIERACLSGWRTLVRADFKNVFIGYVNLPIACFSDS